MRQPVAIDVVDPLDGGAALRDAGIAFKDLDTKQSSLEDIFVGLINEKRNAA